MEEGMPSELTLPTFFRKTYKDGEIALGASALGVFL